MSVTVLDPSPCLFEARTPHHRTRFFSAHVARLLYYARSVQSGGYQLPELLAYSVPALYALASLAFIAAADSRERV